MTIQSRNQLLHTIYKKYENLYHLYYAKKGTEYHQNTLWAVIGLTNFEKDIIQEYNNYYNNNIKLYNNYYSHTIDKLNNNNRDDYLLIFILKQLEDYTGININLLIEYILLDIFDLEDKEKIFFYKDIENIFIKLSDTIGAIESTEEELNKNYNEFDNSNLLEVFNYCMNYLRVRLIEETTGKEL